MNPLMRVYEPLTGINGVASGGTATQKVPANRRHLIHKITCSGTDGTGATTDPARIIDSIVTKIGNRVIRDEKVADIIALRALNKLPTNPSDALSLYYADPSRSDVMDEIMTAWDTFGLPEDSFTMNFKLLGGLTNPQISVLDCYDSGQITDAKGAPVRNIVKRSYLSKNLGTVGDINDLPIDLPITAIYLKGEAGKTIDHVKVTVDDTRVIHDMDRSENALFLSDYNLDATQFHYPLLFNVEGRIERRLEGIRNLKIRVTSSAAQTVTVWLEQVAPDYI